MAVWGASLHVVALLLAVADKNKTDYFGRPPESDMRALKTLVHDSVIDGTKCFRCRKRTKSPRNHMMSTPLSIASGARSS